MIKLKFNANRDRVPTGDSNQSQSQPTPQQANAAPAASPATPATSSGGGFKLKLNLSQPPTPVEQTPQGGFPSASEQSDKKKKATKTKQDGTGKGKKRAANDDTISPAAKRVASGAGPGPRKLSIKIGPQQGPSQEGPKPAKIALGKKKQTVPRLLDIRARGKAPPRQKGVGYDSEDSDVEEDPAIQQAFILRMEEGEDANYLREAIATGRIGPHPSQGDAEASIKFLDKNYRRALVKVNGHMYGAALVDLPCIVESMKSFDRKGWWKVADIAQMLLVLGRCNSEEEAKSLPLPREVNKDNMQYAHGLTPPMHWVRKRRFRKRINYNDKLSVEEEVQRLQAADKECEDAGGTVEIDSSNRQEQEQSMEPQDEYSADEDGEDAIETVERDGEDYDMDDAEGEIEDEADADDLAAALQAGFDEEAAAAAAPTIDTSAPALHSGPSTQTIADQSTVQTPVAMEPESEAPTPAANDDEDEEEEESSDEDDDDDDDDVVDEDAAAKAAERAQQMEEIADLEREIERAEQKVKSMNNQLLRQRELAKRDALQEDLRVKKRSLGLDTED